MVLQSNGIGVTSTGSYLPEHVVLNSEVESNAGLQQGYILEKTGIQSRHIAKSAETASYMGFKASEIALIKRGLDPGEIDLIICCTYTADYKYPALACKIAQLLNTNSPGTFDLMANCTGFQVGMNVASSMMNSDKTLKNILIVAVAKQSGFIDWTDGSTAGYFGDGAAAALVERVDTGYGFIHHKVISIPSAYEAVRLRDGGSQYPILPGSKRERTNYAEMNGLEVWKQVVINIPRILKQTLLEANLSLENVDFFIFHQANLKLIEYVMARMKIPMSKTHVTVHKYGNTADASIGVTLNEASELGKIKQGDVVAFLGVGAGFIFGCTLTRWGGL